MAILVLWLNSTEVKLRPGLSKTDISVAPVLVMYDIKLKKIISNLAVVVDLNLNDGFV